MYYLHVYGCGCTSSILFYCLTESLFSTDVFCLIYKFFTLFFKSDFHVTLFQVEGVHWRSWWGWWNRKAQTDGGEPSCWACSGWASTERCQTPSLAPTASPWSGWLAGSVCRFNPSSLCPQPDTAHTFTGACLGSYVFTPSSSPYHLSIFVFLVIHVAANQFIIREDKIFILRQPHRSDVSGKLIAEKDQNRKNVTMI